MTSRTLNQARVLQLAMEQAKKGHLVIVIEHDGAEREKLRIITLSAAPKDLGRRVFLEYILFESGGELHFRGDTNLHYGREAYVYERRDDTWVLFRSKTQPLKSRFSLMEEACDEEDA